MQPVSIVNELVCSVNAVGSDHELSAVVVVYVPHALGIDSGAFGPPKKSTFSCENGSCGLSLNVAVSCPVVGSAVTLPASLSCTPSACAVTYTASSEPNGFAV